MIQFSFNRFEKLARWSLVNDRSYYVRTFLQMVTVLTLVFLFFTLEGNGTTIHDEKGYTTDHYMPCFFVSLYVFIITVIIGPSLMFYSMKGKHDRQTLLMLPASNLEKYLMRYSTWILLVPIVFLAFFAADLLQYLVNVIGGNEQVMFVTTKMMEKFGDMGKNLSREPSNLMIFIYVLMFWLHSVYALGATFFRSHKYSAIFTTVAIIVIGMLFVWISKDIEDDTPHTFKYMAIIYGVWALVNFWLSYRLFCRTQVKGKFVNI